VLNGGDECGAYDPCVYEYGDDLLVDPEVLQLELERHYLLPAHGIHRDDERRDAYDQQLILAPSQ
jgi:hypothetical protein